MWPSIAIKVDGILIGAAVRQKRGVRFIAIDLRVAEMDQTLWSNADAARVAAEQKIHTGRIPNFAPPSVEE